MNNGPNSPALSSDHSPMDLSKYFPVNELPPEIINHIFNFLSPRSLLIAGWINQFLRNIVKDPIVWIRRMKQDTPELVSKIKSLEEIPTEDELRDYLQADFTDLKVSYITKSDIPVWLSQGPREQRFDLKDAARNLHPKLLEELLTVRTPILTELLLKKMLREAVKGECLHKVKCILNALQAQKFYCENMVKSMLELSCEIGNLDSVKFFLEDQKAALQGDSLIIAAKEGNLAIIEYLFEYIEQNKHNPRFTYFRIVSVERAITTAQQALLSVKEKPTTEENLSKIIDILKNYLQKKRPKAMLQESEESLSSDEETEKNPSTTSAPIVNYFHVQNAVQEKKPEDNNVSESNSMPHIRQFGT